MGQVSGRVFLLFAALTTAAWPGDTRQAQTDGSYVRAIPITEASDDEGVPHVADDCPQVRSRDREDGQSDALPDACHEDGDGVPLSTDNCPDVANPDQSDANRNGLGDACDESDSDGDDLNDRLEWLMGTDPAHPDTDGDRLTDRLERQLGTNPKQADTDNDGYTDAEQVDLRLLVPFERWSDVPGVGTCPAPYHRIAPGATERQVVLPEGYVEPPPRVPPCPDRRGLLPH